MGSSIPRPAVTAIEQVPVRDLYCGGLQAVQVIDQNVRLIFYVERHDWGEGGGRVLVEFSPIMSIAAATAAARMMEVVLANWKRSKEGILVPR
jgi:hypothetical protein